MRSKTSFRRFSAKYGSRQFNRRWRIALYIAVALAILLFGCSVLPPDNEPVPSPGPTPTPMDVWLEIDYSNAYAPTVPAWSYSDTPGWATANWAPEGKTGPEVWNVYNNAIVGDDPIGRCALLSSGCCLQIMLGVKNLISYSSTTVRVEGRSASTASSVTFDVYNPLNSSGTSGSLAYDWSVHLTELDLGSAIVCDEALQAIRIEPTGGSSSLALVRLRITLHDALW